MLQYLLDTSIYSEVLKPKPHPGVLACWDGIGDTSLAISAITEAELLVGLEKRRSDRLWHLYRNALEDRLVILPVDKQVAKRFAQVKTELDAAGLARSEFDLLIAVTALHHNLKVVTANQKHFDGIVGLEVEDWTTF